MRIRGVIWYVLALAALVESCHAAEDVERKMLNLARDRGCMACHAFAPNRAAEGQVLLIAPSWSEIAKRYRGVNNAEEQLTQTVLQGTGPRRGDRHWAGKVSAVGMLPNTVEIGPDESRSLVHWILSLEK